MAPDPKQTDNAALPAESTVQNDDPGTVVENLYKRNIEIVTKNKTLSLLSKLYEVSILTLAPKDLAERVSKLVHQDLSLEFFGFFIFDETSDALIPLAFSESDRLQSIEQKLNISLGKTVIPHVSNHPFCRSILEGKENMTDDISIVWGAVVKPADLKTIAAESVIKTLVFLPLSVEKKQLGCIALALNRSYDSLSTFEQDSINSITNVIAVALEKSFLYRDLETANTKLKELDQQKDAVLHLVAHQLKGPVATINFITELLLDGTYGELTAEQKENIENIRSSSQKMGSQSEMVLDAAKITSGKLPFEPEPVDLNELIKEIVKEAETNAKQRKVNLHVTLPPASLPITVLDRKYTQLAIDNLLSNAIKYTALKSEGGDVYFSVELKNNVFYCSVRDTGVGIPKKDQENIFRELYRASNAGKEGNGLGLHVAKGAIEGQGGSMRFESEEGKGTTFFIELPLK